MTEIKFDDIQEGSNQAEKNATKMITRRDLLKGSLVLGTFAIGSTFITVPNTAWALEVKNLKPATMATLVQMAKDIYPHNHVPTEYYVTAVKGYDTAQNAAMIEKGIAELNKAAGGNYLSLGWEKERVAVLTSIEDGAFFQTIRGGLVTGFYNQKEVWPLFGYEGESYSKGGYLSRGFDDIKWL